MNRDRGARGESQKRVRQAWRPDEDALLTSTVKLHGAHSWAKIAEIIGTRTPSQCSDRWRTQLAPGIRKEGWTPEEDAMIIESAPGKNGRWSSLAALLPGRSRHAVKNRYNTLMRSPGPSPASREAFSAARNVGAAVEQKEQDEKKSVAPLPANKLGSFGAPNPWTEPRHVESSPEMTPTQSDSEEALNFESPLFIDISPTFIQAPLALAAPIPPPQYLSQPFQFQQYLQAATVADQYYLNHGVVKYKQQSMCNYDQAPTSQWNSGVYFDTPQQPMRFQGADLLQPPALNHISAEALATDSAATAAHKHALKCAQLQAIAYALASGQRQEQLMSIPETTRISDTHGPDKLLQQQLAWVQRMTEPGFQLPQADNLDQLNGLPSLADAPCLVGQTSSAEISELMASALGHQQDGFSTI